VKIVIIGAGYVGLVSGVCFADFGHDVICVEKDPLKLKMLQRGEIPIYEPGLDALLHENAKAGRIHFTDDLPKAMQDSNIVFIAVGTPSRRGEGHADLSYVFETAEEIADTMQPKTIVVIKSTVPVGTNQKVADIISARRPDVAFHSASNPEFLREGSAIEDFMRPDRVVIGVNSAEAEAALRLVYRPLNLRETTIFATDPATAEIVKYAANAFLATKISFINEIADLCEKTGGDVQQVAKGMGLDKRIGQHFLHAGPGFGGSCFPKDTQALARTGREVGAVQSIVESVIRTNEARKATMVEKIVAACGGSVSGKRIAVFGVTFKPNTDDMREAPSLVILPHLQRAGAEITVCDPQGEREGRTYFNEVIWNKDPYDAATGADATVLITEWNAFRGLDIARLATSMKSPVFVDLRNVYTADEMRVAGMNYFPLGKPKAEFPAEIVRAE